MYLITALLFQISVVQSCYHSPHVATVDLNVAIDSFPAWISDDECNVFLSNLDKVVTEEFGWRPLLKILSMNTAEIYSNKKAVTNEKIRNVERVTLKSVRASHISYKTN